MSNFSGQKIVGVSLKMYMDHQATIAWAREVKARLANHRAITSHSIEIFVLPTFPSISEVAAIFRGTELKVGSQNLSDHDSGALTGEVSPIVLRQLDCEFSAIGHHERRTLFGEDEDVIARKVIAAYRNEITPVICVGEVEYLDVESSEIETIRQLQSTLRLASEFRGLPTVIAYEPAWAIGAKEPASAEHIKQMCAAIKGELGKVGLTNYRVIYGGSAGPGLLNQVAETIDGLFLGRMAHDPDALVEIVNEF